MALAKDNHVVNAFPPDRPDQPLRISVLPRRLRGCGAIADAHNTNTSDEYLAIGSIAVTDEIAWSLVPSAGLSELQGNPFHGWMLVVSGHRSRRRRGRFTAGRRSALRWVSTLRSG